MDFKGARIKGIVTGSKHRGLQRSDSMKKTHWTMH